MTFWSNKSSQRNIFIRALNSIWMPCSEFIIMKARVYCLRCRTRFTPLHIHITSTSRPHHIHVTSISHPHHIPSTSTSHPHYIHIVFTIAHHNLITSTLHLRRIHITSTSRPHHIHISQLKCISDYYNIIIKNVQTSNFNFTTILLQ